MIIGLFNRRTNSIHAHTEELINKFIDRLWWSFLSSFVIAVLSLTWKKKPPSWNVYALGLIRDINISMSTNEYANAIVIFKKSNIIKESYIHLHPNKFALTNHCIHHLFTDAVFIFAPQRWYSIQMQLWSLSFDHYWSLCKQSYRSILRHNS